MEIKIRKFSDADRNDFIKMLDTCFSQDYKEPLTLAQLERWCDTLTRQAEAQIVFLDILEIDGILRGFVLYQIDSQKSDWCVKEGYGTIREIYVAADLRKGGHGKSLALHAENQLRQMNIPGVYLTSEEEAIGFWEKMGYQNSGEICSENNGQIFVK